MGKAKRWFKRLVAKIRSDPNPKDKRTNEADSRRTATVANSSSSSVPEYGIDDAGKQASATAVKLNSSRGCFAPPSLHVTTACARETSAAIAIQSHFRGYLARRALRALKGLVKLQALVRGHITRKKAAETIRCVEAMLRAQARAISMRSYGSPISSEKSSQIFHPGPQTPEKLEMSPYSRISSNTQSPIPSKGSGSMSRSINRIIIHPKNTYLNSPGWSELQLNHHQRTTTSSSTQEDKSLEIDTTNQHNLFYDPLKTLRQIEKYENVFYTEENSPQLYYSVSSKGGSTGSRRQSPVSQTKSDTSAASCMSGYSDCPSYMAYTESSRAKVRASSVPRQRLEKCGKNATSASTRASFASKAYSGSGRFDRLGMMARSNTNVYYSGCLN